MESKNLYNELEDWCLENGMIAGGIRMADGGDSQGATIVASADIEAGEALIMIPWRLVLAGSKILRIKVLSDIAHKFPGLFFGSDKSFNDFNRLLLLLLYEMGKGAGSFYWLYLSQAAAHLKASLPADSAIDAMPPSYIKSLIKDRIAFEKKSYALFEKIFKMFDKEFGNVTEESHISAIRLINSRAFGWRLPELALLPYIDLLNHSNDDNSSIAYCSSRSKIYPMIRQSKLSSSNTGEQSKLVDCTSGSLDKAFPTSFPNPSEPVAFEPEFRDLSSPRVNHDTASELHKRKVTEQKQSAGNCNRFQAFIEKWKSLSKDDHLRAVQASRLDLPQQLLACKRLILELLLEYTQKNIPLEVLPDLELSDEEEEEEIGGESRAEANAMIRKIDQFFQFTHHFEASLAKSIPASKDLDTLATASNSHELVPCLKFPKSIEEKLAPCFTSPLFKAGIRSAGPDDGRASSKKSLKGPRQSAFPCSDKLRAINKSVLKHNDYIVCFNDTGKAIGKDSELSISYGKRSNTNLLNIYGFALPFNQYDKVALRCHRFELFSTSFGAVWAFFEVAEATKLLRAEQRGVFDSGTGTTFEQEVSRIVSGCDLSLTRKVIFDQFVSRGDTKRGFVFDSSGFGVVPLNRLSDEFYLTRAKLNKKLYLLLKSAIDFHLREAPSAQGLAFRKDATYMLCYMKMVCVLVGNYDRLRREALSSRHLHPAFYKYLDYFLRGSIEVCEEHVRLSYFLIMIIRRRLSDPAFSLLKLLEETRDAETRALFFSLSVRTKRWLQKLNVGL